MKKHVLNYFVAILLILLSNFVITHQAHAQTFVHPGIAFTQADLNQLKANITQEPWLSAYNAFKNDSKSQLSYVMAGPYATVSRTPNLNNIAWINDMVAIRFC